jgi:hypothetical protein
MESVSRPIYFCPVCDILYIAGINALRDEQFVYRFPEVKEIQSVALDYNPYSYYFTRIFDLYPFQNLTELVLVVRYPDELVFDFRYYRSITFFDLDFK